jgi:hypothetical protein
MNSTQKTQNSQKKSLDKSMSRAISKEADLFSNPPAIYNNKVISKKLPYFLVQDKYNKGTYD